MNIPAVRFGAEYYRAGCIVNGNRGLENMQVLALEDYLLRPILSISFFSESLSRVASGRLRNRLILRSSKKNASRKAFSTCSSGLPTPGGSGTLHCTVIGWPGHTGQTSLAALSQTVKTKSSFGAPGLANSSQLLLRKPELGRCAASSCRSASGRTVPEG